jgi:hypothetical protein
VKAQAAFIDPMPLSFALPRHRSTLIAYNITFPACRPPACLNDWKIESKNFAPSSLAPESPELNQVLKDLQAALHEHSERLRKMAFDRV